MAASTEPKPIAKCYPTPSSSTTAYPYPAHPPSSYYGTAAPPPPSSYYGTIAPPPPSSYHGTGTAGPPPPHQQPYHRNYSNNPCYYNNNNSNPPGGTLLRRFFFAMIAAFLVIGLLTVIVWLILRPRFPTFSVASANISSFNLSSSANSNSRILSSTFNFTLSVRNPNKKLSIHYYSVDAAVFLGSAFVSETSLPPFSQVGGGNSNTTIPATLSSVSRYLDADAARWALEGKTKKDDPAVYINLSVFSWVKFKKGGWATRRYALRVYCEGLKIGFPNTGATGGSLVGGPKGCLVHI